MDSEALRIAYGRERPQSRLGEESLHSTVSKALSFARERESSESLLGQEQSRRTISEASRRFPLQPHRSISDALRLARERLGEEESLAEQDGYYGLARFPSNLHADLPVYKIIHR
jgi:hypothetical protein